MNKRQHKKKEKKEVNMEQNETLKTEGVETLENQETETQVEENGGDEIATLKAETEAINDKFLRLNAEFQNYKRRVEKEKTDLLKYGNEKLMTELLPVLDNFSRALSMGAMETADQKFIDGLGMIQKSLEDFMTKNGVKKIEAAGEAFDPQLHHAVMTEEREGCEPDTVIEILQEGYTLNDRVIRPSMVKVSC